MTRTNARRLAVQLSFAVSNGSDLTPESFFEDDYFKAMAADEDIFLETPGKEEMKYICSLVNGVKENLTEIDEKIASFAKGWKLNRISRTALSILRCAVYEICYMDDVPDASAIDEAVELTKNFDEPETAKFVNGVLGGIVRELHPDGQGKE